MMKKITGTVLAGIAAMMLTTTAFAGQGPVNSAPSTTQAIENTQTNRIRYKRRRNRAVSVYDQTESVRGLDIRRQHRRNENFYPEMDTDTDAED